MKNKLLQGTGVALVTPFQQDKSIDIPSLEKLVNYVIESGVEYLVVLGTTAETATLTQSEKELVKRVVKATNNNRVPMVLGIGGNNTQAIIDEINTTNLSDYEAILSVSPYYNKPTQEGIYQHFKAIAESTSHNILLYNVPGRTGVNMSAETTLRLAHEFKNIIGIKEASGNIVQIMQIIQKRPADFLVISGDDMTALPTILMGGNGVISVIGQGMAKEFSQMIREGLQGDLDKATQLQYQLIDGFDFIFREGNPTGIKSLLKIKGICTDEVRLPLVKASVKLEDMLQKFCQQFKNVD